MIEGMHLKGLCWVWHASLVAGPLLGGVYPGHTGFGRACSLLGAAAFRFLGGQRLSRDGMIFEGRFVLTLFFPCLFSLFLMSEGVVSTHF